MRIDYETGILIYKKVLLATKLTPQKLSTMMGYANNQVINGLLNNHKKRGSFPLPLWRVLNVLISIHEIDIDTPKYDPIARRHQSYEKRAIRIHLDGRHITTMMAKDIADAETKMAKRYLDTPYINADDFDYSG